MKLPLLHALSLALLCPLVSAQEIKLLPSDGASDDEFGLSVAISGNTAIVGAHQDDDNGTESGSAYLFDTTTGAQIAKLTASDGASSDYFGSSVAISGNTAIVGAPWDGDGRGSAYIFDSTTGTELAKLTPSGGPVGNGRFGYSVAISDTTAIVGTIGGPAYLFDLTTGTQIAVLLGNGQNPNSDGFGYSVAISGTTAIVGAYLDDDNGWASGAAYLFDSTTGAQIAKLLPSDGEQMDLFGYSVAISGTRAIIGAPNHDDNGGGSGSAYLFDTITGMQIAELLASDGDEGDGFGLSVGISESMATVGAYHDDDNGGNSGSAYLFDANTGTQITKLLATDGADSDNFGEAVANSNTTTIVGAKGDDDNGYASGSAYLFDDCAGLVARYCIASPNTVSATGAPISLDGLPSLSANNMTLRVDSLRPNQFGVFFYGPIEQNPPVSFGDGYRCVALFGLIRLNPPVHTGTGTAQRSLAMTSSPLNSIQAGDTRYFQFWYRDPGVIGAGYNLTDGLKLIFCP